MTPKGNGRIRLLDSEWKLTFKRSFHFGKAFSNQLEVSNSKDFLSDHDRADSQCFILQPEKGRDVFADVFDVM